MTSKIIYPKKGSVIPLHKDKSIFKTRSSSCGEVGYYSMYKGFENPNNLCSDNKNLASWGKIHPDSLPYTTEWWWGRDCITTWSGSYNLPTPFEIREWNIGSIKKTAVVTKITVEYAIQVGKYPQHGTPCFLYSEATSAEKSYNADSPCGGSGNTVKNKIGKASNNPYQITMIINGKKRTINCTGLKRNNYINAQESTAKLPSYSAVIYEKYNKNFTINDLKKTKLIFTPPRNLAADVGRIMMQYVRLKIEYKDIPAEYHIETLDVDPDDLSLCEGKNTATLKIGYNNNSTTSTKVNVVIGGTAVRRASGLQTLNLSDGDTFKKQSNGAYLWTGAQVRQTKTLKIQATYDTAQEYTLKASIQGKGDTLETTTFSVDSCNPVFEFNLLDSDKNPTDNLKYSKSDNTCVYFQMKLNRNKVLNHDDYLQIDTGGLEFSDWTIQHKLNGTYVNSTLITKTQLDNIVTFSGINKYNGYTDIVITAKTCLNKTGFFDVIGKYINNTKTDWSDSQAYNIQVIGPQLPKDYFKLRLEDGSDVKYNSLMVTMGDDLTKPLQYNSQDINDFINNITVTGEKKRVPVGEAQFIHFKIKMDQMIAKDENGEPLKDENGDIIKEHIELNNVLANINIYDVGDLAQNIIIGASDNVKLYAKNTICKIDTLSSKEETVVKLAVLSSVDIDDVVIKLKPYNYDGYVHKNWIPAHVMFKDIPNIKILIEGISDITYTADDDPKRDFNLYYKIQNLSNVDAKNVRFQLKEPTVFQKIGTPTLTNTNASEAWFNEHNRIITIPTLPAEEGEVTLNVPYRATKKGIYTFSIVTLDDESTLEDDQYKNIYNHQVMVNMPNYVKITTDVSKKMPYVDELIDFHINVKNFYKKQDTFKFDIFDIGKYDSSHDRTHYCIEYVKCKNGTFTPMPNDMQCTRLTDSNKVGTWTLNDIGIDDEYNLTISVRPQDVGYHIFKTVFTDNLGNTQDFYNEVHVLEKNKQIDFNVYHAVDEKGTGCDSCEDLTPICDDDFINLNDDIYYVFQVKNNNRSATTNAIHVYGRLPDSFLDNGILCSSYPYLMNEENNLISFTIPGLPGCEDDGSLFTFCIKVKPSKVGRYVSNFSLSSRNTKVLYKQLHLTVDTEFNERKIEHEIKIYNFDKTNRYYRYEIDNVGEIFKFFNTGDKTLRPIETEKFAKSSIETYKGNNLKLLVDDIQKNSKYVDPVFLRIGNNKLANKGYELYPDGFIRRFGLLNSEVFHYSGQFPKTSDLVDRAMKWDVDSWDSKVWAGDPYDNGIFNLTIDYNKVPSNFNILDVDYPIKNLQSLVDNVKPYGTKAICYFSTTVEANLSIDIETISNKVKQTIHNNFKLNDDFDVITLCNRFDNTNIIYYELNNPPLTIDTEYKIKPTNKNAKSIGAQIGDVYSSIFADSYPRYKTEKCYEMIANTYNKHIQSRNIDIVKPYTENYRSTTTTLLDIQILNFNTAQLHDKKSIGFKIKPSANVSVSTYNEDINDSSNTDNNEIYCIFVKEKINNFIGFKLILNDKVIHQRNINSAINHVSMEIQVCQQDESQILHFWGCVNQKEYIHIGLLVLNSNFQSPTFSVYKQDNDYTFTRKTIGVNYDPFITFRLSNEIKSSHNKFSHISSIEGKNKWTFLNRINRDDDKYAFFENKTDIDPKCGDKEINVPKLVLKYDDIDLEKLDEIVDIKFKIDAQSNKTNFIDGININLFKDGDKYIPNDNIAREIYYPSTITNVNQKFLTTMQLKQDNITICNRCLKTSLGYHETCPHCGSEYVQYSEDKKPATACYNCGWIINGWNDYCTHCLSYDIEKIQIDYNKTYCNQCGALSDNYYEYCPQCLSSNVIHMTNNTHTYTIFNENRQNIDPITIQTNDKEVYAFTLTVPLNNNVSELQELDNLTLTVHATNNNTNKYYYCEACGSADIGHYDKCPYCGSEISHNQTIDDLSILKVIFGRNNGAEELLYNDMDSQYELSLPHGHFTKDIDLLLCAQQNNKEGTTFTLNFKLENQKYDEVIEQIMKFQKEHTIRDEYIADIIEAISSFNIVFDNISLDSKYSNEREWIGLDKLQGADHTGVKYKITPNSTDALEFGDFNIHGKYKHVYLYINGLFKNISPGTKMKVVIRNNGKEFHKFFNITSTLFNLNYDILKDIKAQEIVDDITETNAQDEDIINEIKDNIKNKAEYIDDLSVKISFESAQSGDIIITDCNILGEYKEYETTIHDDINKIDSTYYKEDNEVIFTPQEDLWGLNNTSPHYLSGRQLDTGLICYIDFGKLNLKEYIKVYDIDMIIYYKNKSGHLVTETISYNSKNETYKRLLQSAGCPSSAIETYSSQGTPIQTALTAYGVSITAPEIKQSINGKIHAQNGELWGAIYYPLEDDILNKLESKTNNQIDTVNQNDDLVGAIPLRGKIAQSFNIGEHTSIDNVVINYFGHIGYPNETIDAYLCRDRGGQPGSIIASNKVHTSNIKEALNIDFDVYNLEAHQIYWIVLEDTSANQYNYHRFEYNDDLRCGQLITYKNNHFTVEQSILSFSVSSANQVRTFYKLPTIWDYNINDHDGYKIHNILYKYNIQEGSDVSLSNFKVKTGYRIKG